MRDNNKVFEKKKKADYWKTRLADSGCDPRHLSRHVDNVLCQGKASLSPVPVSHTAEDFQRLMRHYGKAVCQRLRRGRS